MSTASRVMTGAALLLAAVGLSAVWAQSRPSRESFNDRYGVLIDRNIFLRDRFRPTSAPSGPTSRPAPVPKLPESVFVLTGVVLEDGEFRAYIENIDRSSILKLRVGDPVARGTVSQIGIDAIEYDRAGLRVWIDVGRNLVGERVTSLVSSSSPAGGSDSTTQPSSGTLPDPNNPNLSLEEKMRLRRMQELNRK